MFNFSADYFLSLLLSMPGILLAISFHEMAHGFAADAMGDPTPKLAGRLTVNPLKHIDPLGLLSMVLFRFGWAKPVPVNPLNFKDRKKGMIIVALSGILTNLLLGFLGMATYLLVVPLQNDILMTILYYIYIYNIVFAVFNLLPIPPLDGSKVLLVFLPNKALPTFYEFQKYGMFIILGLAITGLLSMIINPVINGIASLYSFMLSPLFMLIWS
ncbi:site-2 protease family protein [Eubacteriaceae bacterium ES3]|nr:site-2 protease family protein [Eubacteriaceae bacterium ES3]